MTSGGAHGWERILGTSAAVLAGVGIVGQITGALMIDAVFPGPAGRPGLAELAGPLLALVAVAIAVRPRRRVRIEVRV